MDQAQQRIPLIDPADPPRGGPPQAGLVSVVIPAYNSEATLRETVEAILAQSYPHIEIVIVDDGSRDGTEAVMLALGDRIRGVRQPNGGVASARNTGMAMARGEFIVWLDGDDLCLPERIEMQVAYFRARPDVVLCSSDFSAFNKDGVIAASYGATYYGSIRESEDGYRGLYGSKQRLELAGQQVDTYAGQVWDKMVWGNFVHPPTVAMRRTLWEATGQLDPQMPHLCDYEWLTRAAKHGAFGFLHAPLLRYRLSPSQLSGPANTEQSKIDTVRMVDTLKLTEPAYYAAHRQRFLHRQGLAMCRAAAMLADEHPGRALHYLLRSFSYGHVEKQQAVVVAKLVIPLALRQALRRGWRGSHPPAAAKLK